MWSVLPKSDTFGQEIKIELVIDNESRDLQLYNDSFLILIGRAKVELLNFLISLCENSKWSYCPLKLQVSFGIFYVINFLQRYFIFPSNGHYRRIILPYIALLRVKKNIIFFWQFLSSELGPIPSDFGRTHHYMCFYFHAMNITFYLHNASVASQPVTFEPWQTFTFCVATIRHHGANGMGRALRGIGSGAHIDPPAANRK